MSSSLARGARRYGPWGAWAVAAGVALWANLAPESRGTAPAMVEVRSVSLSSPEPARVAAIEVRAGDAVSKGQVVARLDSTRIDGELAIARARLSELESNVRAQEAVLRVDRFKLADREASQAERAAVEVAQYEADEKRDRARLEQLDEQLERQAKLVEEQLSSVGTLNALKLERAALAKRVEAWAATVARAKEARLGADKRAGTWGKADPLVEQQLEPLRAAARAEAEHIALLERLHDGQELKAPFGGRVSAVLARAQESVRVGQPLLTITDDQPTQAVAWVDQAWAGQVEVGDEVVLVPVDRSSAPRKARVVRLGPGLGETPVRFRPYPDRPTFSREAFLQLEAQGAPPLPGQAFRAEFKKGKGPLPPEAVSER